MLIYGIRASLSLGDRVKRIGPEYIRQLGKIGTVVGYNWKGFREGRECYYVIFDGYKSKDVYHVDYLSKINTIEISDARRKTMLHTCESLWRDNLRYMWQ